MTEKAHPFPPPLPHPYHPLLHPFLTLPQMSKKAFWGKAEYLFRTRNVAAAEAEAADDDELALFVRDDPQLHAQARQKHSFSTTEAADDDELALFVRDDPHLHAQACQKVKCLPARLPTCWLLSFLLALCSGRPHLPHSFDSKAPRSSASPCMGSSPPSPIRCSVWTQHSACWRTSAPLPPLTCPPVHGLPSPPALSPHQVQRVDPTLNVLADVSDDYSSLLGHGILRDGRKEAPSVEGEGEGEGERKGAAGQEGAGAGGQLSRSGSAGGAAGGGGAGGGDGSSGAGAEGQVRMRRTIFRDINQHAAVVLQGRLLQEDVADTRELATAVAEATALHAGGWGNRGEGGVGDVVACNGIKQGFFNDLTSSSFSGLPPTPTTPFHLLPRTPSLPHPSPASARLSSSLPHSLTAPHPPPSTPVTASMGGEQGAEEEWRRERAREMAVMADLRGDAPPTTIPLTIQDPRKYFDAATQRDTVHTQQRDTVHTQQQAGQAAVPHAMDLDGPGPATESTPAGTHATLAASLAAFGSELAGGGSGGSSREHRKRGGGGKGGATVMAPAAAAQEVEEFGRQVAVARRGVGEAAEQSLLKQLPDALRTSVLAHGEAVKELLSHFWATYPLTSAALLAKVCAAPTSVPASSHRSCCFLSLASPHAPHLPSPTHHGRQAERHKEGISKLYDRLQKLKDGADGANRHLLSQLLQPFFQSLDAALAHFETDNARRQQRRQRVGAAAGRAPLAVGQR
ncbi:unnamed protein product [Closterium sp. NIES-53]